MKAPPIAIILLLSALYFVQGLPFGFQANALPLFLRQAGLSLTAVGFSGLLALPWMLKVLWAPLVDRYGSTTFGRRKSWIVPLQFCLALACIAAAFSPPESSLWRLMVIVLVMNFFTATQDIAVDGLAVSSLTANQLGLGNTAQVVGYKVGMLAGGGVLVALFGVIGWSGMFLAMAGICLVVMTGLLFWKEPLPSPESGEKPRSFGETLSTLWNVLKQRDLVWLLFAVATYKIGESMADRMFGPFLIDQGFKPETIGAWMGTWGMVASLLGSTAGGLLASRGRLLNAILVTALFRALPLVFEGAMVAGWVPSTQGTIIFATCAEHFFGGALTTTMFAYMMSRVDKRIGATHYTLLAAVEVIGKAPSGLFSGAIADKFGFPAVFVIAVVLSLLYPLVLIPLRRAERTA